MMTFSGGRCADGPGGRPPARRTRMRKIASVSMTPSWTGMRMTEPSTVSTPITRYNVSVTAKTTQVALTTHRIRVRLSLRSPRRSRGTEVSFGSWWLVKKSRNTTRYPTKYCRYMLISGAGQGRTCSAVTASARRQSVSSDAAMNRGTCSRIMSRRPTVAGMTIAAVTR